jgi:hypothetical protein
MIVLRVAMGRGLLEEMVEEISTALVFAKTGHRDRDGR